MKSYAGFVIIVLLAAYLPASEQQSCAAPPPISRASGNIFSPEQEMMLGDIVAERVERDFRLVHDEKLNAYVQTLGERLVRHVPIKLKLTFRVVDIAEVNAYTLPGGRIYVTRKLVAFVRSEDELAGVLGHEIGHAVASDPAYTESLAFKKVLGITSISHQ